MVGGEPVLKGTRVTLSTVLSNLAEGATVEDILRDFPTLTEEHVRAVIAFAAASAEDLEVAKLRREIAIGVRQAEAGCPAVVESLKEAGDELFALLRFPRSQWRALRTMNAFERINKEFRQHTKTQASLPGQDAVLLLLRLLRRGQGKLRTLDGYQDMKEVKEAA